jgi:hypothetical protein
MPEPELEDIDAVPDEAPATITSEEALAAAAAGEPDPQPAATAVAAPEVDPLVLVDGMVPVYNPCPFPLSQQWSGDVYRVRSKGIDLWPRPCADMAVGPDNSGGPLSVTGLRRLYGPEPRLAALAVRNGVSVRDWAARLNRQIRAEADAVGREYSKRALAEVGGDE